MTSAAVLRDYVAYGAWANRLVLAACAALSEEQLHSDQAAMSHGNVKTLLCHLVAAQTRWYSTLIHWDSSQVGERRTLDDANAYLVDQDYDFSSLEGIATAFERLDAVWRDYADSLSEEIVERRFGSRPQEFRVAEVISHVLVHGIHHRGELAVVLTGFGHSPGELSYLDFHRETR